ncbi:helix-turn-helix transcriptional regulator [Flavobacterium sp. LC2016-23]|uniref:response regulator transcription factor n=1 Tax=Flavobacterium sp. LC2016-23 TaxID=2666330 RepID=UPI0012AFCAC5|nr:helix-turn-helix transcriptional regulator [Flavobacterium sp. LC2016-23]MRX41009.1 helix-turn-helix transcriptional regulator [Flavobacterium sp. LC2016-23]
MEKQLTGLYSRNSIYKITEADKHQLGNYIEVADALSKLTYQSIYIIDYEKMTFDYVSDNPLFLCGYTVEEVLKMGYSFYLKNVPEKDLEMLNLINELGFDFYGNLPLAEKKEYCISYDFSLTDKSGKKTLVNHQLTPLFITEEGKLWKSLCVVSISGQKQAGNIIISKHGSDNIWKLNSLDRTWVKYLKPKLSRKEIEVLRFYAQGMKINQIADKLYCTDNNIKYYRKKIFEKLETSNMAEALSYAINYKLI